MQNILFLTLDQVDYLKSLGYNMIDNYSKRGKVIKGSMHYGYYFSESTIINVKQHLNTCIIGE